LANIDQMLILEIVIRLSDDAECINSAELWKLRMGLEKILSGELNFGNFLGRDCF
jgi:hypothetical protein